MHRLKQFPVCPLCNQTVELETTKTNEDGEAVHEECYVLAIKAHQPKPSGRSARPADHDWLQIKKERSEEFS
jgi:hypothetical protein